MKHLAFFSIPFAVLALGFWCAEAHPQEADEAVEEVDEGVEGVDEGVEGVDEGVEETPEQQAAAAEAQAKKEEAQAIKAWFELMERGEDYHGPSYPEELVLNYTLAYAMAPTDEYRADTLFHLAQGYESVSNRDAAIETYLRLLDEYPDSGHVPRVLFRLGDVHATYTLLPPEMDPEEVRGLLEGKFGPEFGMPYFEQGAASATPLNRWVMRCHSERVGMYARLGQGKDTYLPILYALARLEPDAVGAEDVAYVGPYQRMKNPEVTPEQRIDEARMYVTSMRDHVRENLVRGAMCPLQVEQRIANLEKLIADFAGTELEVMAREKLDEVRAAQEQP